jgi:hypothetical protein
MVKNKPIFWAKRVKPNDFMGSHLPPTSYPQSYPQISWKTINHLLTHNPKGIKKFPGARHQLTDDTNELINSDISRTRDTN